jgi:hypothetical protein
MVMLGALLAFLALVTFLLFVFFKFYPLEPEPSKDFSRYEGLASGIRAADGVLLYEGLPHQYFESIALEKELRDRPYVRLHRFPFYKERLTLSDGDGQKLTDLFCSPGTFRPRGEGMKACGGFHPDYCIEWHVDGEVYQVLVCLGCCEVKCYGPGGIDLYCDIKDMASFEKLLRPYRKNRPPFRPDGS